MSPLIKLLLVDGQLLVRAGVRLLLETQPDFAVVGEAHVRDEVLHLAASEQPDIILLGLILGQARGVDLLADLQAAAPQARVILLTGVNDADQHRQAVRLGAVGLVRKEQAPEVLMKAIRKVHDGEVWLDRAMLANVLTEITRSPIHANQAQMAKVAPIASLTDRELGVIALICTGLPNKEISRRLGITDTTVRHHLTSIYDKLGCSSRLELIVYAYQYRIAAVSQ